MPENNKKEGQYTPPHSRDASQPSDTNAGNGRKRRAEDQLSPYSQDLFDPVPAKPSAECDTREPAVQVRRARARMNRDSQPANKSALKGIFGRVSLTEPKGEQDTKDLMAGLNRSFLKALGRVMDRQSNKDLRFLFSQYEKFVSEIKRSESKFAPE